MKIDIWTHILTPSYARQLEGVSGSGPSAASFLLGNRALRDVDYRLEIMDRFGDYQQVLNPIPGGVSSSLAFAGQGFAELVRRNNEEMAEIVLRHPDRFAGFAAATPLADPDAATEEAIRSVRELGALGVQLEEDAINLPLHESRYEPLFAAMDELGAAVWLHPYRTPAAAGFPKETAPFLLWQVFTWTFDTTITVSRLAFAGIYDRYPALKIIAHHGGGLIPHFSGRIEMMPRYPGLDPTLGGALERLQKQPIEYFRMLYVDTAMFGSRHGCSCVVEFFGPDHVLFGTDTPLDTEGGGHFIPVTIADVEAAVPDKAGRKAIFEDNARKVLRVVAPIKP